MTTIVTLRWPDTGVFAASVGPAGFVVFLDLAHQAEAGAGCPTVATTLRDLADRVGLSKDTVHRHLRDLEHAGVVERTSADDPFTPTTYRLLLDVTGIELITEPRPAPPAVRHRPAETRPAQTSLPFGT